MIAVSPDTLDALAARNGTWQDAITDTSTGRRNAAKARLRALSDGLPAKDRLLLTMLASGTSARACAHALGVTHQSLLERKGRLLKRVRRLAEAPADGAQALPPLPDLDTLTDHLAACGGCEPRIALRVARVVKGERSGAVAADEGVRKRTVCRSVQRLLARLPAGCPTCDAVRAHRGSSHPADGVKA